MNFNEINDVTMDENKDNKIDQSIYNKFSDQQIFNEEIANKLLNLSLKEIKSISDAKKLLFKNKFIHIENKGGGDCLQ